METERGSHLNLMRRWKPLNLRQVRVESKFLAFCFEIWTGHYAPFETLTAIITFKTEKQLVQIFYWNNECFFNVHLLPLNNLNA